MRTERLPGLLAPLFVLAVLLPGFVVRAQEPVAAENPYAPDIPEPGSVEAIREYTTSEEYLPESVAYLPESDTVPSPTDFLGRLAGAPGHLSSVAEVHGYFRRLAETSFRVEIREIGRSEEGRESLLAVISDFDNLARLNELRDITGRLADPRQTSRAEMDALVAQAKPFYYLLGGLHSPETGSPEMLMELAYRLAVSERPEIQRIRRDLVVLITPVVEVDGRDRQVQWYRRHLRPREAELSWEELREFASPPYWGHYVFHDNNRDGMQLTQALTRAVNGVFFDFHPQVVHDLHESVPLLYISTGHGPYSRAVDPVTINEWTQFAHHEAGALQAQGLPGIWTWGFWDGWWPGYLVSVANNHHAVGRFYETFGNSLAGTFERKLKDQRYVGKPVTEVQWYRPWPPDKKVVWSLRNNTNYMQAAVLQGLHYAALHGPEILRNFWIKGARALEKGRSEAPYAWVFPERQDDPSRLAHLVNLLRAHRIEVHRLTEGSTFGGWTYAAGSYVVRMDQPYRNAALNFLERQRFPKDEPNPPYDDVAWTWPLLFGVEGERIDDRKVLEAAMTEVTEEVRYAGTVQGSGGVFLLKDQGQLALLRARMLLAGYRVEAVEETFELDGASYPIGSWIVRAPWEEVDGVAAETGLTFQAADAFFLPEVPRHEVDLPRLAVLHTWTSTQDCGWVRYTLDREGIPYTLISPDDLKAGGLGSRFDVILFPNTWGDLARIVHGIDPRWGPLPYTQTEEYPSHGIPNSSPDITGGMGFRGLLHLQQFVEAGGVLVALGNAGTLAVDGGLVRRVRRVPASSYHTPGSEVRAKVLRPEHPIAYGYPEETGLFRGNLPLWEVADLHRDRVVVQFGLKKVGDEEEDEEPAVAGEVEGLLAPAAAIEEEDLFVEGEERGGDGKAETSRDAKKEDLLLSGFVRGKEVLDGTPAILDLPVGQGRVILFAFNPLHRHLNLSDFRFVYNVILHWNDLPR